MDQAGRLPERPARSGNGSRVYQKERTIKWKEARAADYIIKPFSPLTALARVKTHIELKRRGDMLERHAGLDGLIGIFNRRRFDDFLSSEWKRRKSRFER